MLARTLQERQDLSSTERIFLAARQGDPDALRLLHESAYYLGMALANVVNLFNPELILLGGMFSQGQDLFIEPTLETVRQMSFGGLGEKVRLQPATFGWKAGVMGAAALALMQFFYQPESERYTVTDLRIALIPLVRTTFDVPLAHEMIAAARQALTAAGLTLVGPAEPVTDLPAAQAAAAELAAAQPRPAADLPGHIRRQHHGGGADRARGCAGLSVGRARTVDRRSVCA